MKKILIISKKFPLPENTGTNIRTMNFVRFFQSQGIIDLAHSDTERKHNKNDLFHKQLLLGFNPDVRSLKSRLFRLIRGLPKGVYEYSRESEKELNKLITNECYDIILVRYITTAATLFKLPSSLRRRIILDFDDLPSDLLNIHGNSNSSSLISRIKKYIQTKMLKSFEKKCLNFGSALFCSSEDKDKVTGKLQGKYTYIVPNILKNLQFDNFDFSNGHKNISNLLFVGTLGYPPNQEGITWFIRSIFPCLLEIYPSTILNIVGRNPAASLIDLCSNESNINLHIDVPDLKNYYKQCGIVIVPLLTGGGTRIKILEAGLARRPVISTKLGAHGLNLVDGKDIMTFESGQDFVANYEKLLDQSSYTSMVNSLEKIVKEQYSESAFNSLMETVVNNLDAINQEENQKK